MEQYAVYENNGGGKAAYPFLLNIQHSLVEGLGHIVMVPLVPLAKLSAYPPKKLCPLLRVKNQQYAAMTHMLGGVPPREIGGCIRQLDAEIYDVKNAFDFLLNGI